MVKISKWRFIVVALVVALSVFYALPNVLNRDYVKEHFPEWWQPVNLGLDLQGGSYLLLEVKTSDLVHEQLTSILEATRSVLRENKIRYVDLRVDGDFVKVKILNSADLSRARDLIFKIDRESLLAETKGSEVVVSFTSQALVRMENSAVEQSVEIVRKRIDELGTREPSIYRQGGNRIQVQLPGVTSPERIKQLLGKTAKMAFYMVDETTTPLDAQKGKLPASSFLAAGEDGYANQYVLQRNMVVGGEHLTDAQVAYEGGAPVVAFKFDSFGAKKFANTTRENVGKRLAIHLDGRVISAPVINSPIVGGSGIITGNFTSESARDLALMLRAGALPAPLEVIEERTVGPDLGADSIEAGKIACVLSMLVVLMFMIVAYGLFGLFANVALLFNVVMQVGALSMLQATLTLPGIAGIVLTIGMSVDANILVYERMREELRAGRMPLNVVEAGFRNAFSAIIDSNLTSLFCAFVLFFLGTGPVKGFGVTFAIGIVTTMFTAILMTKLMMLLWLKYRKPKEIKI